MNMVRNIKIFTMSYYECVMNIVLICKKQFLDKAEVHPFRTVVDECIVSEVRRRIISLHLKRYYDVSNNNSARARIHTGTHSLAHSHTRTHARAHRDIFRKKKRKKKKKKKRIYTCSDLRLLVSIFSTLLNKYII